MITKIFNNGWGNDWPITKFEQSIVQQITKTWSEDNSCTIVINSTWYTTDYHQQVLAQLKTMSFDRIVLIAMLDPAIPHPDWYAEFDCPVIGIGYYPGQYHVDFWALVLDHYYKPVDIDLLLDSSNIDKAYMCLNRKPHWHRVAWYKQLERHNLLDLGIVTMGGDPPVRVLSNDVNYQNLTPNAGKEQFGIGNDIVSLGNLQYWTQCLVNIVTETAWNINQTGFVSEKIYKPIVGCRPFLVYDTDGASSWLNKKGFESYIKDFTDISDRDLSNPENMSEFLVDLTKQGPAYYQKKLVDLRDKIMYNKNHFDNYVTNIKKGIQCQI